MTETAHTLTTVSLILYAAAMLLYAAMWLKSIRTLRVLAPATLGVGLVVNLVQLVHRWLQANQPPFKTLYESLVLLAACIALVYLIVELVYRARILGLPSALACAAVMLYALLRQDKDVVNLPPALQSGWFIPHVVVYFFGYAAVVVAAGAAAVYLHALPERAATLPGRILEGIVRVLFLVFTLGIPIWARWAIRYALKREDLIGRRSIDLEALLDGAVRFGFGMLTVGLLMGCAWAKVAWGDYWVWDPKETWSLVTWLIFAAYLHLHYLGGWRGKRLALLVLAGFCAVAFTYLGMNLLPTAEQSVHVYQ